MSRVAGSNFHSPCIPRRSVLHSENRTPCPRKHGTILWSRRILQIEEEEKKIGYTLSTLYAYIYIYICICACYRYVNVPVALHVVKSACPRGERWERKKNTFSSLAAGYSIGVLQLSAFTPLSRRAIVFFFSFLFFSVPSDKTGLMDHPIYTR